MRAWARGGQGAPKALDVRRQGSGPINLRVLQTNVGSAGSSVIPARFLRPADSALIEVSGIMQCGPTVLNTGGGETLQIPKTAGHSARCVGGAGQLASHLRPHVRARDALGVQVRRDAAGRRELIDDTAVGPPGVPRDASRACAGQQVRPRLVNEDPAPGQPANGLVNLAGATPVSSAPSRRQRRRRTRAPRWTWNTRSSRPTGSRGPATGSRLTRPSRASGRSPTPWAAPSGSLPRCWGRRPAARQAARRGPVHARSRHPARSASRSVTSRSSSCVWSAGSRFERSDDFAFGSGLVTFRAILRGDGTLVGQTGAIKMYQGSAS